MSDIVMTVMQSFKAGWCLYEAYPESIQLLYLENRSRGLDAT
jgi:hypothetical protein